MRYVLAPCLFLLLVSVADAQQIVQISSGWCSPNIANVDGDVVIKCIGIPPPVHKKLTEELEQLRSAHSIEVQQLVTKANEWVERYNELNKRLQRLSGDPIETKKIRDLVAAGEIEAAAQRLDSNIEQYDSQIATLAEFHFLRARVAALTFDLDKAKYHLQKAYQLQSTNSEYLLAYTSSLIDAGQIERAENILHGALPSLRKRAKDGSIRSGIDLISALDELAVIHIRSNRLGELDALSSEALDAVLGLSSYIEGNASQGSEFKSLASTVVFSLGRNNLIVGRLAEAEKLLGYAFGWNLDLCSAQGAHYCAAAANAIMLTGEISRQRGNNARAVERFQLALDTLKYAEGTSGPYPERAAILSLMAEAELSQKNYETVKQIYREILDTWRQGDYLGQRHRYALAHANNKLGEFAMGADQFAESEAAFRRALTLTRDRGDLATESEWALASMNLGHYYLTQNKGTEALPHAEAAVQIYKHYWELDSLNYQTFYARSLFVLGFSQLNSSQTDLGCQTLAKISQVEPGGPWAKHATRFATMCIL